MPNKKEKEMQCPASLEGKHNFFYGFLKISSFSPPAMLWAPNDLPFHFWQSLNH